jgi:UDP-N-acetylglucosamine transferase subunit ALG13
MVFVTVGSAQQSFRRLLEAVDQIAGSGGFGQRRVFMQIGHAGGFTPSHCGYRPFLSREEFDEMVGEADFTICHGGATPLEIIHKNKPAIVMPRRKLYGEIMNDHQVEFVESLAAQGWVIPAMQAEDLPSAIAKAISMSGRLRPAVPSSMVALVSKAVDELLENVNALRLVRRS